MSAARHSLRHLQATVSRAVGLGAVILALSFVLPFPKSYADATPAQNRCDELAGSAYDLSRNPDFAPVDEASLTKEFAAAIPACQMAFEQTGNPRFAFQLGRAFDGQGDIAKAVTAWDAASARGYAIAKVHLGVITGRMGDADKEFKLFKDAAEAGNGLGAYNLGVLYRDGTGTPVEPALAINWFERASAQGYGPAAYNLGVIYDEGKIVPEDNGRAINWYKVAAARGEVDAMVNLGLMLEAGEGTERNMVAAAEIYQQAAERGDEFAAEKVRSITSMMAALKSQPTPEDSEHVPTLMPDIEAAPLGGQALDI